jgi:methylthioribose-1-phosphate isomerase
MAHHCLGNEEPIMEAHIVFDPSAWTLKLLDQRRLPWEETWVECRTVADVVAAIRPMVVRGAPAIGVAAAYGCALACREVAAHASWRTAVGALLTDLAQARPTAVNLSWAVGRVAGRIAKAPDPEAAARAALDEARAIHEEDVAMCRAMGRLGAALLPQKGTVLTHCNAGALATGGYGTALGVIRAAREMGKDIRVLADETRPLWQGARLTAYELARDGIPVEVICEGAAASMMARGEVDAVIVGADRIAANGDTANKIGTLGLAVLARHFGVPFYVAAPHSTFDLSMASGAHIPIEERAVEEVTHPCGSRLAPEGVGARNPAFDVTPAELISAIITEQAVLRPPTAATIAHVLGDRV